MVICPYFRSRKNTTTFVCERSLFPVNAYEEINLGSLNIVVHAPIRSKGGPIPLMFALAENVQIFPNANNQYATTERNVSLCPFPATV
jgi:hypothetical protein